MFVWMGKISGTGAYWLMNNIIICFINDKDFVMCIILTITTYVYTYIQHTLYIKDTLYIKKIIQHTLYIKDTLYILSIVTICSAYATNKVLHIKQTSVLVYKTAIKKVLA